MTIYYVRPDGNNLNTGLGPGTDQAFATISKAASVMLAAGDKAIVSPGDYRELVVTAAAGVIFEADHLALNFPNVAPGKVRITGLDTDTAYANPTRYGAFRLSHADCQIVGKWWLDSFKKSGGTAQDLSVVYVTGARPIIRGIIIRNAPGYGICLNANYSSNPATYDQALIERCDLYTTQTTIYCSTQHSGLTVKDNRVVTKAGRPVAATGGAVKILRNYLEAPAVQASTVLTLITGVSGGGGAYFCGNVALAPWTIYAFGYVLNGGTSPLVVAGNTVLCGGLVSIPVNAAGAVTSDIYGNISAGGAVHIEITAPASSSNKSTLNIKRNRFANGQETAPSFLKVSSGYVDAAIEANEFYDFDIFSYTANASTNYTWSGNRWAGVLGTSSMPVDAGAIWGQPATLESICEPTNEIASPISGSKSLKLPVWLVNLGGGRNILRIPADLGDVTVRLKAKKTFLGGSVTFDVNNGQAGKATVVMADNTDVQILDITGYQGANGYLELRICAEAPSLNTAGTDAVLVDDIEIV